MNEEYDIQQPVTDVTENTEAQPVEENEEGIELTDTTSNNEEKASVKTYTDEELERIINERVNKILPTKIEREKSKIERTYRDKLAQYEETQSILSAGLGTNDITESNQKMREFYKEQGIDIPAYQQPRYSDDDERALGELEASKIIKLGFDEMQEEANRLASKGTNNMSVRDKAMFTKLANELTIQKNRRELAKIGVKADVLENSKFKEFTSKFNSDVPIQDIYEMYSKVNNKESQKYEQIGSLKNNKEPYKKEYFTEEDIAKMTDKELEENWEAIRRFQTSGYKK